MFPEPIILPASVIESVIDNADQAALAKEADVEEDDHSSAESVEGKQNDEDADVDADAPDDAAASAGGEKSKEHALTEEERAAQAAVAEEEAKEKQIIEAFKKAELAVKMAKENLSAANAAMDIPPALSKEFVKACFPYDHGDGHYEICVVCGLGGDILCCETCPNVAHTNCAGLAKVPEGDWYCRECVANGKEPSPSDPDDTKKTPSTTADADADAEASADDANADTAAKDDVMVDEPMKDAEGDAADGSNTAKEVETEGTEESKADEAGQDTVDDAKPSGDSSDEPSAQGGRDSEKKVSFEEATATDANSSNGTNKAAAPVNDPPPGHWPIEEKRYDEESEKKSASLENILQELKALRYKPKSSSKSKGEDDEEKKDDDDDDDDDDGADSDADFEPSSQRSRRRSTKATKRPRRKRALIELGTKILKEFEGHGDFEGVIEAVPDSDDEYQEYYRVRYLDGDEEDMSEDEAHACVDYWKEKEAQKEPDDPNVRKRRKPKRFETVQAAAELKGSRKKDRRKSGGRNKSPSRGRISAFKECAVEGCTKQSQGRSNNHMCRKHFMQTQRKWCLHRCLCVAGVVYLYSFSF